MLDTGLIALSPDNKKMSNKSKSLKIALAGNPNSGKTSIFNRLTGAQQKVGNWGGVTVEIKEGKASHSGREFKIVDLPGTYSLTALSLEETVARDYVVEEKPDVVIDVIDSTNLERNLYLTLQLIELNAPLLLAFNMSDEAEKKEIHIDTEKLSKLLGAPIIRTVGRTARGVEELLPKALEVAAHKPADTPPIKIHYPGDIEKEIEILEETIIGMHIHASRDKPALSRYNPRWLAIKLLEQDRNIMDLFKDIPGGETIISYTQKVNKDIENLYGDEPETLIAESRYGFIAGALKETMNTKVSGRREFSDTIDKVMTHKALAFPLFFVFMWLLFQATFKLGDYPMTWISIFMDQLGSTVSNLMPEGYLRDLVVEGIIGGVGGVIVFLPNILILFLGISIMEDSGYMARAAFIMDKVMHYMGLHGKSFISMVMGFGCNVPAVMAARTLESRSDRVLTILLAPLMSCSARLPVYILFAGTFFPGQAGNIIFAMYVVGIIMAFALGKLFRNIFFKGMSFPFVMELPPYRLPTLRSSLIHMWQKAKHYLQKMGGVVLVFSILLWFLGSFPENPALEEDFGTRIDHIQEESGLSPEQKQERIADLENEKKALLMKQTYIGRAGNAIEPLIRPLGFDWRGGVSLLTGFVAKEIVVSSMGVLYAASEKNTETNLRLGEKLRESFTPLSALAFMVFVLLYTPCIVTLVVMIRELRSWKWSLFSVGYQLIVAWAAAFIIYQGGRLLGLG
jgi:ferrous iron transport protein B